MVSFFQGSGMTSSNAELLMTGMSSRGDNVNSTMLQAKAELRMREHNETMLKARLIKLKKEQEKAQHRIRLA